MKNLDGRTVDAEAAMHAAATAQDASVNAQVAAGTAIVARNIAAQAASDAVSQGNVPIYSTRNAVKSLAIPEGITAFRTNGYAQPGDGGETLYRHVPTEPRHADKVQSADGRWWRIATDRYSVKHFGAVGDGVADDTAAINAAIAFIVSQRTSPEGRTNYGQDTLFFPKGRYRVTSSLLFSSAPIDIQFEGAGMYASAIEYHADSGALFACNQFICVRFRRLFMGHVPQNSDRATWTCALWRGNGAGGGRQLSFDDCATTNFDRVIDNTGGANFDTFNALRCDFRFANTFYYARSSQALCNTLMHCTVSGPGSMFDVAGGWWVIVNCNLTMGGTWLTLHGQSGLFGVSCGYKFIGCKGEPMSQAVHPGGSRSAILRLQGSLNSIFAQVMFDQCMFTSGVAFDPSWDYPQLEVAANMSVIFTGGGLRANAKIKLHGAQTNIMNGLASRGLQFRAGTEVPPPAQIMRVAGAGTYTWPAVVYHGCDGVPNLCLASEPRFTLGYDGGTVAFAVGALLTGATSGATARILVMTGATASGTLTLVGVRGVFLNDEPLADSEGGMARANGTLTPTTNSTQAPIALDDAEQTNTLGSAGLVYTAITFGAPRVLTLDFHGSQQDIVDIVVTPTHKAGGDLFIETSLDGFTTVLDTFYVPGGQNIYPPPACASALATGSKSHDWPSLRSGAQQSTTVTVLGARAGDEVVGVAMSVALSGTRLWGEVTADNTVTIWHRNDTGGDVNVSSGTLSCSVRRARTAVGRTSSRGLSVRASGSGPAYGYVHVKTRAR